MAETDAPDHPAKTHAAQLPGVREDGVIWPRKAHASYILLFLEKKFLFTILE